MSPLLLTLVMTTATTAAAANPSAAYIQRTMKSLEDSTAETPAHVRVMFYGQSITSQAWTQIVQENLTTKYPTVDFEFHNAAIGGYTSPALIRTADHDLYPWYPDLLFFHVYGPMNKYEEIKGNRVVAISNGNGKPGVKATVFLDGKPMDDCKDLWAISRPSRGPAGIWMPAINHIGFDRPLLQEDWTLTCLPDSTPDGKKIHFRVHGTKTGDDGEGWNTEQFVSNSGRVIIEPSDWRIAWTLGYRKATLPEGFTVTWKSYPLFTDAYAPQPAKTRTLLVQGCANEEPTLTLSHQAGDLGIRGFVVYAPPK